MSEFVDYSKRSVELPNGYKDLGEVLATAKRPYVPIFPPPLPKSMEGGLDLILGGLGFLLCSKSPMSVVTVLADRFTITVTCFSTGSPIELLLAVPHYPAYILEDTRKLFAQRSIKSVQDSARSGYQVYGITYLATSGRLPI